MNGISSNQLIRINNWGKRIFKQICLTVILTIICFLIYKTLSLGIVDGGLMEAKIIFGLSILSVLLIGGATFYGVFLFLNTLHDQKIKLRHLTRSSIEKIKKQEAAMITSGLVSTWQASKNNNDLELGTKISKRKQRTKFRISKASNDLNF